MTYDNIKTHKKSGFQSLSRKWLIFIISFHICYHLTYTVALFFKIILEIV